MLEQLLQFDIHLFYLINTVWSAPLLDVIMPWLRNMYLWIPLYVFIGSFFLLNYRKAGVVAMIYLVFTIIICDQFSSDFIKPLVERIRPCNDANMVEYVRLLLPACGVGYSFPSSHAANHFGAAFFLGILFLRKSRWVLSLGIVWAAVVCYAQIYVGVHYPVDVAVGAFIGIIAGSILCLLCKRHLSASGIEFP